MGESHHTRNMEWNTGEVWPVPVECLLNNLNGMNTHSISDAHHLMFGNATHHMSFPHFRHRFQPPPVHLPSPHLGPLPLNVNVSIPQHSMVTGSGQVENSEVSQDNCQDPQQHSIPQPIPLDNHRDVVLDETDEVSDDETDEEEEEEEEEEDVTMDHHDGHTHGSLVVGMTHSMDNDNNLVQCSTQIEVPNSLQQPTIIPMNTACQVQQQQQQQHSCLQQKQTNMNIIQHRINGHSQSHSHSPLQQPQQQQQQSMNSLRMTDDFTLQNENSDPNSGFSVQGKMYFEGRVVLHLKQWADSAENNLINGNVFSSCAEQQPQKVHGCAVCRLKPPTSQESRRSQKEAHRHTVKGVLFTFEDCIIVELYPETPPPTPSTDINNSGLPPKPQQTNATSQSTESQTKDHTNPIVAPYMNTIPIQTQEEDVKKFIVHHNNNNNNNNNNMEHMNCLGNQQHQQNITGQQKLPTHHNLNSSHPSHAHTESEEQWWNEFTTSNQLKQQEGPEETDDDVDDDDEQIDRNLNPTSSCIENLQDNENSNNDHRNDFKIKPQKCSSPTTTTISAVSISDDDNNNNDCPNLLLPHSSNQQQNLESQSHSCPHNHHHQHQQNSTITLNGDLSSELSNNVQNAVNSNNNEGNTTSTARNDGKQSTVVICSSSSSSSSSSTNIFQIDESQNSCTSSLSSDHDDVKETLNQNNCRQMKIIENNNNCSTDIITRNNTSNAPNFSRTNTSRGSSSSKLRFSCPVCDRKKFQFKKLLKQHLEEMHFQTNPFYCLDCTEQFTEEKTFTNHPCNTENTARHLEKTSLSFGKMFTKTGSSNNNNNNNNKNNNENQNTNSNIENENKTDEKIQENPRESKKNNNTSNTKKQNFNSEQKSSIEKIPKQNNKNVQHSTVDGKSKRKSTVIINFSNSPSKCSSSERNISENCNNKDVKNGVKIINPISNSTNNQFNKDKSERPFKCEICHKQFTVERRLQNHKLSHSVERSSVCEKCGKKFSRKDKLIRHMYVHAAEKLFSCEICQKRFSRRDKLSDHLKSHGGADEIHNCPMCQKKFLRPDILKQHVKLHTMGNKYQCTECLRFVTGKGRLEKHMDRHKEAKASGQTLLCPLCTKYFIQKQSLKAHFKKFHPESDINLDNAEIDFQQQEQQQHQTQKYESSSTFQQQDKQRQEQQLQHDSKPPLPNQKCKLDLNSIGNKSKEFKCNQCHKQFLRKQALKKHLRKHHTQQQQHHQEQQHCLILSHSRINNDHIESNIFTPSPVTNTTTSPDHEHDDNLPSSSVSPAHILSSTLTASSPAHTTINNNNNPTMVSSVQNLNQPCILNPSHLHQHGTLSNSHHNQHHILPAHTTQGIQISPMSHTTNHAHLSQHITVPAMAHQLNTQSINQAMCNSSSSSYVLAYPQYSYQ